MDIVTHIGSQQISACIGNIQYAENAIDQRCTHRREGVKNLPIIRLLSDLLCARNAERSTQSLELEGRGAVMTPPLPLAVQGEGISPVT